MKCPKCHSDNTDAARFCSHCAASLTAAEDAQPSFTKTLETPVEEFTRGTLFAERYEIIEELGKGGMGNVYRVEDIKTKEEIALKLIKPEIAADSKTIERFRNELTTARKIRHKNICGMYDLAEDKGTCYITMEYVPGQDLKGLMRQTGRLAIPTAISIANQVCEGLSEAHRLGVVHRDLKPANIMIDKEGNARIMDFGIARSLKAKGITGSGIMIGTPEYMSPEQVEAKDVDQRSDIYSLGVVLYEMTTGRTPFEGDTPFTIGVKHKSELPKDPRELNAQIPEGLGRVILKCLEKEKDTRFQSAGELLSELTAIEEGIPTTERAAPSIKTTTSKEVTLTFQRRWMWAAILFMIAAASVLTFLILKGDKSAAPKKKANLIVLPFENLGPPEEEYFANGITAEITDRLSFLPELDIMSYNSAIQFKKADKTIRQIREDHGVDYVVTGRVLWDKSTGQRGRVYVSPQLIDAANDTQLWTAKIESSFENIADVQARIAEEVVRALDLTLLEPVREAMRAKRTENPEAYDFYLQARTQYYKAWAVLEDQEFAKTIEMYKKATNLDPGFVDAWLGLSFLHSAMYFYGIDRSEERLAESKAALDRAREIRPDYPNTNLHLAYYYFWGFLDTERAEELYESVRKVRPNTSLYLLGHICAALGRFEEALDALEKQSKRDPLSSAICREIATILTQMRKYEEAETWFDRSLSLDPGNVSILMMKILSSLEWKGYSDEAGILLDMLPAGAIKDWAWIFVDALYSRNFEEVLHRLDSLQLESFEIATLYFNKDLYYAIMYHMLKNASLKESHAESARIILKNLVEKFPEDAKYRSALGIAYALLGRKEDALLAGKKAVELYPISKDALWGTDYIWYLYFILIIAEEYEEALDRLEHLMSIPAGRNVSITSLQSQPSYDPLRDLPRFMRLLEKYSDED